MLKLLLSISLALFSLFSFAQTAVDLNLCLARLEKTKSQLFACEHNPSNQSTLDLQRENLNLRTSNLNLQARIDELTGVTKPLPFICSAACVDVNGTLDKRYLEIGIGSFQAEADLMAKQTTQKTFSCNFGVKAYKCEKALANLPVSFCVAACVDVNGNADERYSAGEKGRNATEAEILALKSVQKQYKCNFGVKLTTCN